MAVISFERCSSPNVTSTASSMLNGAIGLYRKYGVTFSRYSPTVKTETSFRRMSLNSSNRVKTSRSIRNVPTIIAR